MEKIKWNKRKIQIGLFLLSVFSLLMIWSIVQPLNASPDESMRYDIVEYIVRHGTIPDGRNPEIRHGFWGISYAFNPILSYMIMAIPAKIVSLYTSEEFAIIMASRLVNIVFGTLMAYLVLRIGEMLFAEKEKWMFVSLITFLPSVMFVHSYINSDSIALFSIAWIVYAWIRSLKEDWSWKVCIHLACAISMCGLSYYNAYGFVLCSIFFFISTCLLCRERKMDFKFLFSRGGVISAIVLILIGWWFIRNAILYNGDFLGWNISTEYAEMYAIDELKPSNRVTPMTQGMTIWDMFQYKPESWPFKWIVTVAVSFIGTFGFMSIYMPYEVSRIYILFFLLGFVFLLPMLKKMFSIRETIKNISRDRYGNIDIVTKKYEKSTKWNRKNIFHVCMFISMVIPFLLLIKYSYANDLQAQGRYILPMVIPFMYFVTKGYQNVVEHLIKKEKIKKIFYMGVALLSVAGSLYTLFAVFLPNYL